MLNVKARLSKKQTILNSKLQWEVVIDNRLYQIEFDDNHLSGKKKLYINGVLTPVNYPSGIISNGQILDYPFQIGNHQCAIRCKTSYLTKSKYDLLLDGYSTETLGTSSIPAGSGVSPIPIWGYIIGIMLMVPLSQLYHYAIIPCAIAGGGFGACIQFSRDNSKSLALRVGLCIGVFALCYTITLLLFKIPKA